MIHYELGLELLLIMS